MAEANDAIPEDWPPLIGGGAPVRWVRHKPSNPTKMIAEVFVDGEWKQTCFVKFDPIMDLD